MPVLSIPSDIILIVSGIDNYIFPELVTSPGVPWLEHHGAGGDWHDQHHSQEWSHLLPRLLPNCSEEVPRGWWGAVRPGDVQGKGDNVHHGDADAVVVDVLWHWPSARTIQGQEIQNKAKVSHKNRVSVHYEKPSSWSQRGRYWGHVCCCWYWQWWEAWIPGAMLSDTLVGNNVTPLKPREHCHIICVPGSLKNLLNDDCLKQHSIFQKHRQDYIK